MHENFCQGGDIYDVLVVRASLWDADRFGLSANLVDLLAAQSGNNGEQVCVTVITLGYALEVGLEVRWDGCCSPGLIPSMVDIHAQGKASPSADGLRDYESGELGFAAVGRCLPYALVLGKHTSERCCCRDTFSVCAYKQPSAN